MNTADTTPMGILLTVLYGCLALGVATAATFVSLWLARKAQESKVFLFLAKLFEVAKTVVAFVEARVKPSVVTALQDGKISETERLEIQNKALAAFKEQLGGENLAKIRTILGVGDAGLDAFLFGLLERALASFRSSEPQVLAVLRPLNPTSNPVASLAAATRP